MGWRMKDIAVKELINRQTTPINADTTPSKPWHDDLEHCLNPALAWRTFRSGTNDGGKHD